MKFFYVYNDDCFVGLEKNGLINKDTGFKIQHCFAVPSHRLFNNYAAKGTRLHSLIKSERIPFYVDRIAGGITWYPYTFDKALIEETMPCTVDALHWLASTDENGKRYLTIFNNAGNERDIKQSDIIHHEADRTVTVTFKEAVTPEKLVEGNATTTVQRVDDKTYRVHIPATSFVILAF